MQESYDLTALTRDDKLQLYSNLLELERDRRLSPDRDSAFIKYLNDPVGFVNNVLNEYIWSKQREICEAVRDHDRVAVKSCHESGKSFISARIVGWWTACHPPGDAFVVTSAPTFTQVRAILWREINRVHARGDLPGRTNQTEWVLNNEIVALGRKPEDASPDAFQGLHALKMLVVFDEACGMPPSLWNAAETLVANDGGKILAIGNPDDPNTEFGKICKPGSGWHVITISAFDTPNMTGEEVPDDLRRRLIGRTWVEARKSKWGETSPLYQSKVLGEFPEESEDNLISPKWVVAAINRELLDEGPSELGVDVARFGRNESVIYHRVGRRARLQATHRKRDLMTLCGMIVKAVLDTGATVIKIDDAGMGGGVTDRLNEIKREDRMSALRHCAIVPVNVGMAATERVIERIGGREITAKQRFSNLKAELTWQLRNRFEEGDIDLGEDEDTQAQTTAIRYEINSRGLIVIEGKDALADRLGEIEGVTGESKSPDRFDALVLCFADVPKALALQITGDVLARSKAAGHGAARVGLSTPHIPATSVEIRVSEAVLRRSRSR